MMRLLLADYWQQFLFVKRDYKSFTRSVIFGIIFFDWRKYYEQQIRFFK